MNCGMRVCSFRQDREVLAGTTIVSAEGTMSYVRGDVIPGTPCTCGGQGHLRAEVPGTILSPWDADFSVTYCGPEAEASNLRIAVSRYHAAAAHVEDLLRLDGAGQRAYELVAVDLGETPFAAGVCPSCGYEQLCPDCGACHCGAARCGVAQVIG